MIFERKELHDRLASEEAASLMIGSDLVKSAKVEIEAYNAYVEAHGLFADMIRDEEQGDNP